MSTQLDRLASSLFGGRRAETMEVATDATTRTYVGTAVSDSEEGTVVIELDGDVTLPDDVVDPEGEVLEEYDATGIEVPTAPSVSEGDEVIVTLVGGGALKTPMVTAVAGEGDAQNAAIEESATTATRYITAVTDDGIWVTPSDAKPSSGSAVATTSGWHISDALELFRLGVSMFKAWVDSGTTKVRVGADGAAHLLLQSGLLRFMNGSDSLATIGAGTDGSGGTYTALEIGGRDAVSPHNYERRGLYATSGAIPSLDDGEQSTVALVSSTEHGTEFATLQLTSSYYDNDGTPSEWTQAILSADSLTLTGDGAYKTILMSDMYANYDMSSMYASGQDGSTNSYCVVLFGVCHLYYQGNNGSRSNTSTGTPTIMTLPEGCRPSKQVQAPCTVNAASYGVVQINSDGTVKISYLNPTTATGRLYFNVSYPVT